MSAVGNSNSSSSSLSDSRVQDVSSDTPLTWQYGGKLRRLPEGFRLVTKISLQVLHQLWYEGIKSRRIGPFKFFDGHNIHKDDKKHLSSARALVTEIDKFLPAGFLALNSSDSDAAFKVAFNLMASSFQSCQNNGTLKRKALENSAFTTLYTNFYLPSKKKRDTPTVQSN